MNTQRVITKPIVTEKAMKASEVGKYSFLVDVKASKTDIKRAIAEMYKVSVVDVQTTIVKGRKMRTGMRRMEIALPNLKKAVVKLKKGEKIGALEAGGEEANDKKKKKK